MEDGQGTIGLTPPRRLTVIRGARHDGRLRTSSGVWLFRDLSFVRNDNAEGLPSVMSNDSEIPGEFRSLNGGLCERLNIAIGIF